VDPSPQWLGNLDPRSVGGLHVEAETLRSASKKRNLLILNLGYLSMTIKTLYRIQRSKFLRRRPHPLLKMLRKLALTSKTHLKRHISNTAILAKQQ
jgi:hypothetical protein